MKTIPNVMGSRIASPIASGLYWSGIWLAIGAVILSILLTGSSVSESALSPWVFSVHGIAALAGGFASARRSGRKGWYFGLANGVLYTLLILMISFLATDGGWSGAVPTLIAVACLAGAFGGMLGVSTRSTSR
ncbi:MAG: TIGR04086 family membrane protein [Candidatus Cohnella colombiensis]|uniref:TIGR04086 family membrane protein n=1 Tax=Candidatus Cohnella colombiensis TaxID=3121368 RepID=A0AA95EZ35_9BACL|nr:MAG: TIGR04086 family membrane protein [Cohnella sp.]